MFFVLFCVVRPPLWSSSQSSWLQVQRSGFDSRRYQIFWEVVGLQQGPFSLVSRIEALLETKCSGSSLESRKYSHRDLSRWPPGTLYPRKLALTSPRNGSHSVNIVHSRTQATEFLFVVLWISVWCYFCYFMCTISICSHTVALVQCTALCYYFLARFKPSTSQMNHCFINMLVCLVKNTLLKVIKFSTYTKSLIRNKALLCSLLL
jgi:hypothetical protein